MWVVIALASLAVLFILVLCVPLDIALRIDVPGRPKFRVKLAWLFGLVSKEVREGKKPEETERAAEGERKPGRKKRFKVIFQLLRTKGLLRQFKRLIGDVLRCLKLRDLAVNFRVGFDNPADTGLLFALIGPATFWLSPSFPGQIRLEPSFADEAVCEGYLRGTVRLSP